MIAHRVFGVPRSRSWITRARRSSAKVTMGSISAAKSESSMQSLGSVADKRLRPGTVLAEPRSRQPNVFAHNLLQLASRSRVTGVRRGLQHEDRRPSGLLRQHVGVRRVRVGVELVGEVVAFIGADLAARIALNRSADGGHRDGAAAISCITAGSACP
jgi:hypothetical protein